MVEKRPIDRLLLCVRTTAFLAIAFGILFLFPGRLDAASLIFSPASGTYAKGQTFSVSVYASSADQALNAVSASLSFSKSTLQVVSVSKAGSLINVWVTDPAFSNPAGTASFEGVILNPGYKGTGARLVTITFRVLGVGNGTVNFSGGSILANDGNGTALPLSFGSGRYTFIEGTTPPKKPDTPPPTDEVVVKVLGKPTVTSPTHPNPLKWYRSTAPTFEWSMDGATGASFVVDQNPTTEPDTESEGTENTYTSPKLAEDGVWFFHVKVKNSAGWSETAHYSFQIDQTSPISLEIYELEEPRPGYSSFIFNAYDEMSGIIGYRVAIDDGAFETIVDENLYVYTAPRFDDNGEHPHLITVAVYDAAGNSYTTSRQFYVTPEPGSGIAPHPLTLFIETYAWAIFGVTISIFILFLILLAAMMKRAVQDVRAARRRKRLLKHSSTTNTRDPHSH